jgi:hypothetical protein
VLGVSTVPFQLPTLLVWAAVAAPPALQSRGAFLTIATVAAAASLFRPTRRYFQILLVAGGCLGLAYATGFEVDPGNTDNRRVISVQQLLTNLESIVAPSSNAEVSGTKRWRELWWEQIIDYTFFGEYFWTGKGFGINLATADGFQLKIDNSLRSPHSIHMTVLGRAGVPGVVLWGALQLTFGLALFLKFLDDRRAENNELARVEAWILLYWLAFLINGSFDVAIEGPQNGIWFWSVFGFGLALIVAPRRRISARRAVSGAVIDQPAAASALGRR